MSGATKVGRRQWQMLCLLDDAGPLGMRVSDLLAEVSVPSQHQQHLNSLRGMANKGLVWHLCADRSPCMRPIEMITRTCRLKITERGRDVTPNRVGRHGPRRHASG